jgi:hypothetical protein
MMEKLVLSKTLNATSRKHVQQNCSHSNTKWTEKFIYLDQSKHMKCMKKFPIRNQKKVLPIKSKGKPK